MKYPFRVYQAEVENHLFWIAECPALKGCVGQGSTPEEACAELETNESEWLEIAKKYGIEIPEIPTEQLNSFSGKFTVRIAPYIHEDATNYAKQQNISLSQYVNNAVVAQNSRLSTINYIAPELKNAISSFREFLFDLSGTASWGSNIFTVNLANSMQYKMGQNKKTDPYTAVCGA